MMERKKDRSTYSAIFAVLLIVLIIVIIGYSAVQDIVRDWKDGFGDQVTAVNTTDVPSEGTVLYENLSDEEADQIIKELLQSGKTNLERIEEIESIILDK